MSKNSLPTESLTNNACEESPVTCTKSKGFRCPFKSPLLAQSSGAHKRKLEDVPLNEQENDSTHNSTPKFERSSDAAPKYLKSNKRHLSFRSPFHSPVQKPLQETNESLKQKLDSLLKREKELDKRIQDLEKKGNKLEDVQLHIDQLHKYNEMKDASQTVLGRLAAIYEISLKEIHRQYDAPSEN